MAELGRFTEAERLLAAAESAYRGRDWWVHSDTVVWGRGIVTILGGRPSDAIASLQRGSERQARMRGWQFGVPMCTDLAWAGLEAGLPDVVDRAAQLLDQADLIYPWQRALRAEARACQAIIHGTPGESAAGLEAAIATLADLEWKGHGAQAQLLLGLLLALSDKGRAAEAMERAIAGFEACGAVVRADRARQALSDLATKRSRRPTAGPGELTPREREVVGLAMDGLTSKEIGQKLFIGERTVESHLARAYTKLGVGSRLELVRRAAELGLTGS